MSLNKLILLTALLCLFCISPAFSQKNAEAASPSLIINLPSRTVELYSGNQFIKSYPVAIGKPSTPTPIGNYSIVYKEVDPWWYPPGEGYFVPSGPNNPLGYRWMGFSGNYGLHGTNAPWSIGSAVSNGCVRMQEEDVEELYELIPVGTPLAITYDRVKVRIDAHGEASIGIYPDVYGYGNVSLADVKEALAQHQLAGIVGDEFLLNLIQEEPDRQVVLGQLFSIKTNDSSLPDCGIIAQDVMYVPVLSIAKKLNLNVTLNPDAKTVSFNNNTVSMGEKCGTWYVTADNLQTLIGGAAHWLAAHNQLNFNLPMAYLNGHPITSDIRKIDNMLAINAIPLSQALGKQTNWNTKTQIFTLEDKQIPVFILDNKPYIHITKIYEYFKAYVYWNSVQQTVELTYPCKDDNY